MQRAMPHLSAALQKLKGVSMPLADAGKRAHTHTT